MNLSEITSLTEEQARDYLESIRWPDGPVCPHCGEVGNATKLKGKSTRPGVYKCKGNGCRKQFTVTVGTIFERSHIPLRQWVIAYHLMCSSKKGISAHQLHRSLGICYKSSWFMCHRIRYAMSNGTTERPKFDGTVEMDETYVGGKPRHGNVKRGRGAPNKTPVVALVERDGRVRAVVMLKITAKNLRSHLRRNAEVESALMTDQLLIYRKIGREQLGGHSRVNHGRKEYVRGDVHINTAESFFALLKRGIYGAFHHCGEKHLHRYVDEFAFRWDNRKVSDSERRETALAMAEGKRLTYVQPCA